MICKPLAIDLYCGLRRKAKFGRRADAFVQQFVTCWAKYPDHVSLTVRHEAPSAVALMAWSVRHLKHSGLSARFAGPWKFRVLSAQPLKGTILVGASRIVDLLNVRFPFVIGAPLFLGGGRCADRRAITLIAVGRWNLEVRTADAAIAAGFRDIGLLAPAPSSHSPRALGRAVNLVWPLGLKREGAFHAEQIIHADSLA